VYHPPVILRAAALLALLGGVSAIAFASAPLAVEAEPVPLNASDPTQTTVGQLAYRGGLWLRSRDPRFGGLSDLRVAEGRERFQAVSDCGAVVEAGLSYDAKGLLAGLLRPRFEALREPGGGPLKKGEVDAEALAPDGRGGFLVAFEGRPRLWHYPAPAALRGAPSPMQTPAGLDGLSGNAGIEAMTRLPDGRYLLIAEGTSGQPAATTGWIGKGDLWSSFSYPLVYDAEAPREPFRPTSVTLLPGSDDVLVLERRFPPLAVRIRRVERAAFERGVGLVGSEVARLAAPLSIDNLEGIDAVPGPHGEILVFVVSDDNNCAKRPGNRPRSLQRTLLLVFSLRS
jgi:hypothetical protein